MYHDSPPIGIHAKLHARLLEGDELAADDLATELLPLLERSLRRSFKAAPRDAIVDAVVDALVDYIRRPERFEPSREVPLRAWLRLAATRNLQDALRRASRREAREQQYAEERSRMRSETPRVAPRPRSVSAILRTLCAPSELPAAMARLSGERRTSVLARLLGLTDCAEADQRREVKRFNDRLRIRLATRWRRAKKPR